MLRMTSAALLGVLLVGSMAPPLSGNQAKKPRPPQPTPLTAGEVSVIGEDLFYDPESLRIWGPDGLKHLSDVAAFVKNGIAIRSGIRAHFVMAFFEPTPAGVVTHENQADWIVIQTAMLRNSAVRQVRERTGGDMVVTWGQWLTVGRAMPVPPFVPSEGFSILPTGAAAPEEVGDDGPYVDAHESLGHSLGAGHDDAHSSTGSGAVPTARGFVASDGRCDIMSIDCLQVPVISGANVVYQGIPFGDATHDNVGEANRAAPLVAAYFANPPQSLDVACREDTETACLLGHFRIQVQWADPNSPKTDWSAIRIATGTVASFWVGSALVRVSMSSPSKISIAAPSAGMPYRIVVTDTSTGHVRAWQSQVGQAFSLTVPKF